ncbi:MAG: hypothetical protein ACI4VU_06270, partial [Methanobrevibacter sp.]
SLSKSQDFSSTTFDNFSFFMASGFCFKNDNSNDFRGLLIFVKRRFLSLWVPFIIWTSIFSLLHNTFISLNLYTDNPSILDYTTIGGGHRFGLGRI